LRKWSENYEFFGDNKFVNTYIERDKKIMKAEIFALTPSALLIDFPTAFTPNFLLLLSYCGRKISINRLVYYYV